MLWKYCVARGGRAEEELKVFEVGLWSCDVWDGLLGVVWIEKDGCEW